jgi:hypothetical protein
MMSSRTKWIGAALIGGVAILGWRWLGSSNDDVASENPSLLFDRIWVEKKPEKYTDYVHGMYVGSYWPVGFFDRDSAFDHHSERFDYKRDRNKIQIAFPQSGRTSEFTYEVKACDAPPPFDLCLDLNKNPWGGPERYYGFRDIDNEARHLGTRHARNEARKQPPEEPSPPAP